jgi:Putative Ig domain
VNINPNLLNDLIARLRRFSTVVSGALAMIFAVSLIGAARGDVIASWDFTYSGNTNNAIPAYTNARPAGVSAANVTVSSLNYGAGNVASDGQYGATRDCLVCAIPWPGTSYGTNLAGAIAKTNYFKFTVQVAAGYQLNLNSATIQVGQGNAGGYVGGTNYLLCSLTGFADGAQLGYGANDFCDTSWHSGDHASGSYAVDLTSGNPAAGSVLQNLTNGSGAVEFRVYTPSSGNNNGTMGLQQIILFGSVVAVAPPHVTITTTNLVGGATGIAYSQSLNAIQGYPPYTWSVVDPADLPGWANLTGNVISGTPDQAGTNTFTIQVTDSHGSNATQVLSLAVTNPAPLQITTASLPGGTAGFPYSQPLVASGGVAPYYWQVDDPQNFPPGLSLDSATGLISGSPTTAGSYTFTIDLQDYFFNSPVQQQLTIAVASPPAVIASWDFGYDDFPTNFISAYTNAQSPGFNASNVTVSVLDYGVGLPAADGQASWNCLVTAIPYGGSGFGTDLPGAIANTNYFTFTISVASGYSLNLSNAIVEVGQGNGGNSPASYFGGTNYLMSSRTGFTAGNQLGSGPNGALLTYYVNGANNVKLSPYLVDLTSGNPAAGTSLQNLTAATGPVEFRVYTPSSGNNNGAMGIQKIVLYGGVTTNAGGSGQPPTVSTPVLVSGSFQFTFNGTSGQTYEVLSSTNVAAPMTQWVTNLSGTFNGSPVTFATNTIGRANFYRVRSP